MTKQWTSFILPIYLINNELLEATERCLMSMSQETPNKVIIVDDGSPLSLGEDNYFVKLVNAKIIRLPSNQGYTKAVNAGLKDVSGSILIVGNNDLLFPDKWLTALIKPLLNGYDISSLPTVEPGAGVTTSQRISEGEKFGSIFAFKRAVYDKLGGLDEGLGRGYFTDLDFQKRAEDAGFRVGKNYELAITHQPKSTYKLVDPEDTQYEESKIKFKKKHGSIW